MCIPVGGVAEEEEEDRMGEVNTQNAIINIGNKHTL